MFYIFDFRKDYEAGFYLHSFKTKRKTNWNRSPIQWSLAVLDYCPPEFELDRLPDIVWSNLAPFATNDQEMMPKSELELFDELHRESADYAKFATGRPVLILRALGARPRNRPLNMKLLKAEYSLQIRS